MGLDISVRLDTDPLPCLLVEVEGEGAAGLFLMAISSVHARRKLRKYSSASRSTTSSLVSCSTALIRCTT